MQREGKMEGNGNSLDQVSSQYDEESSPVETPPLSVGTDRDGAASNAITRSCRVSGHKRMSHRRSHSAGTLASEKDPRARHAITLSYTRRSSLRAFSTATSVSARAPLESTSHDGFEEIDLQDPEGNQSWFGELDKFGNKRLSAGYHSRLLSRGSSGCTERSTSSIKSIDCSLGDSQPGAYSMRRDDISVDSIPPTSHIDLTGTNSRLIEATIVEAAPRHVPVVEASPIDDKSTVRTKKGSITTCCLFLYFLLIMVVVIISLVVGLIISIRKQSSQGEPTFGGVDGATSNPATAPTVVEPDQDIPVNVDTLFPDPTSSSFSMQEFDREPSPAPISVSPPAGDTSPMPLPTFQPSLEATMTMANTSDSPTTSPLHVPSGAPSLFPSESPSNEPSARPSTAPTSRPSSPPSVQPTVEPSLAPSYPPTESPTILPTVSPTVAPTESRTRTPTLAPTRRRPGNGNGGGNRKWNWVWSDKSQKWIRVKIYSDC